MHRFSCFLVYLALSLLFSSDAYADDDEKDLSGIQTFVTRPDIQAPKWDVTIYEENLVTPGYWFTAPYEHIGASKRGGAWIGPHIFDGDGGLIWSGSHLFDNINIMDFHIDNFMGEERMSMIFAHEGLAYILDNHFNIDKRVRIGITGHTLNMHDFHSAEDGTHYLYLNRNITTATRELSSTVDFDGECKVIFAGFQEVDIESGEVLFDWSSREHIPLTESTWTQSSVQQRCSSDWDYLHTNAVDKTTDGNYILSARNANAVYKLSGEDGSIMWKLGGFNTNSDFEMGNLNFSRQHHVRFRGQNETHTLLTIFDNASATGQPRTSSDWSRALMVALRTDTQPMTAEIVKSYDHPHGGHASIRGDYQILPNGHAWICWSDQALSTEQMDDGKLIMEARMQSKFLGTYRTFKFPFVGEPANPPDVHSATEESGSDSLTTNIYVSWNGATEVASWKAYKTDESGTKRLLIDSIQRTGFETALQYEGYASYVILEAFNGKNQPIGESEVIKTTPPKDMSSAAVMKELDWLKAPEKSEDEEDVKPEDHLPDWVKQPMTGRPDEGGEGMTGSPGKADDDHAESPWTPDAETVIAHPWATFISGFVTSVVIFMVVWAIKKKRVPWQKSAYGSGPRYEPVGESDAADYDETKLDDLTPTTRGRPRLSSDLFRLPEDDEEDGDSDGSRTNARTPYARQASGV